MPYDPEDPDWRTSLQNEALEANLAKEAKNEALAAELAGIAISHATQTADHPFVNFKSPEVMVLIANATHDIARAWKAGLFDDIECQTSDLGFATLIETHVRAQIEAMRWRTKS